MHALVCCPSCPDGVELRRVEDPRPDRDEVLVAARATSLNLGNLRRLRWERDGWRPGYDVAGIVANAAADGSGPRVGERVAGVVREGAWAERVAVPSRAVATIPGPLELAAAAAVPVAGLTALAALGRGGRLLDKRVLITGASGGVGRFAVQLASLAGAHVSAAVSRPERAEGLAALGADDITVGLEEEGPAFDLIVESVGGSLLRAALSRLAPGGTVVSIGCSSDEPTTFDGLAFVRRGAVSLYGMQLFDELERQGLGGRELASLLEMVAAGRLDPQVEVVASWRQMGQLLGRMRDRSLRGKAVALID